ncbi:ABC transporter permease [Streptomyces sp. NBC_00249]|uniref:ABC transporter permease n=1 Tax=Streptomyces sp. NBC_00249 TaxID=2975690 RepID=UPI0022576D1A|nr:ABC transporter permease [Streptomyces sp. NBC_00249]MCX5195992.1 ABC transporter permease [Streptomyces sp. NBC_00249]
MRDTNPSPNPASNLNPASSASASPVRHQIAAEMLRARSGAALTGLLLGALALGALGQLGVVFADADLAANAVDASHRVVNLAASATLFASLFGALLVTGEFKSGSIGRSVLYAPGRGAVVGAKLLVAGVSGLLFGVVSVLGSLAVGAAAFASKDTALVLDGRTWQLAAAVVGVCGLAGPWGAAIGFVVRNQLVAVLGLVLWGTVGQLLVLGQFPQVGRFLPDGAQLSVLGDRLTFPDGLDAPYGVLLLVAWGAAAALLAQRLFARRDV